jgi:uncharacterized protein (UPF0335 family)
MNAHNITQLKGIVPSENANSSDASYRATAGELLSFIERIERLLSSIKDLKEQIKEVYAELKGRGYSIMAVRKIIKIRAKSKEDTAEEDAILQHYKDVLGMD